MNYDFDKIIDRRGTNSLKWDVPENELPMWVADMDFETAPEIQKAILDRAAHGVFGYSVIPKEWNNAYANWWERRHGFRMEPDWLLFCSGVIPAISGVIGRLMKADEKILIQPPVYNGFYHAIERSGRELVENPLIYTLGASRNTYSFGVGGPRPLRYDGESYKVDFEDLEHKLRDPKVSLMLLCNPQNPSGRIWSKEELKKIGELCAKYHVLVVSDEIHCDITDPGCGYIPFASVSDICRDNSITCIAPTKAFNLAGLKTAAVMVPHSELRAQVQKGIQANEASEPNSFSVEAAIAAFTRGEPWLEAMRAYIWENKKCVEDFLKTELPQVRMVSGKASYLVWLEYTLTDEVRPPRRDMYYGVSVGDTTSKKTSQRDINFADFLRAQAGLYLVDGREYGESGSSFLRMNVGCPRSYVIEGLTRLKRGVELFESMN